MTLAIASERVGHQQPKIMLSNILGNPRTLTSGREEIFSKPCGIPKIGSRRMAAESTEVNRTKFWMTEELAVVRDKPGRQKE